VAKHAHASVTHVDLEVRDEALHLAIRGLTELEERTRIRAPKSSASRIAWRRWAE